MQGTNETTVLDALRESIRELDQEIREEESHLDDLRARRCELRAEEARVGGRLLDMEACLAEARWQRAPTAENRQAMHVADVRASAAYHLRLGIVPSEHHPWLAEVEQTMDEMRGGSVQ
jgi:predicted  nucleic acid-binding Zn-ribbon protein